MHLQPPMKILIKALSTSYLNVKLDVLTAVSLQFREIFPGVVLFIKGWLGEQAGSIAMSHPTPTNNSRREYVYHSTANMASGQTPPVRYQTVPPHPHNAPSQSYSMVPSYPTSSSHYSAGPLLRNHSPNSSSSHPIAHAPRHNNSSSAPRRELSPTQRLNQALQAYNCKNYEWRNDQCVNLQDNGRVWHQATFVLRGHAIAISNWNTTLVAAKQEAAFYALPQVERAYRG